MLALLRQAEAGTTRTGIGRGVSGVDGENAIADALGRSDRDRVASAAVLPIASRLRQVTQHRPMRVLSGLFGFACCQARWLRRIRLDVFQGLS